jgi:MATE family multidrug resistance protein
MPVLHEAALICKLAWPSWSVCNYLPTCLLVLLTCAVPRCMMLTLASSDQRSPVATGSIANLTFISSMAVMAFVGQYGTDALAGAGLGFMWLNVSGQSIIFGTGMGLSALSSQAFGARNYRRVALLVQRQLCYQMLLCAPIGLCWWNTEKILTAFGQPPSVAYFSGQYCRHMLPGLPAIPVFNNLNAFLVSQRIPRPSMMVSLFSNLCVSVPTAFYLSQPHVLGFVGAPLGVASGQICQALLMRIVAPRVVRHPTWLPLQREALHPASWIELIRLGMGGAVGLWAEWWSNELM